MKYFLLLIILLTQSLCAVELTKQTFIGKWCGKWDNVYSLCIIIDSVEPGAKAKYQWLEHKNGKFKRSLKTIERMNRNTLKLDNIWFVLDEESLDQANVFGVFRVQSRVARLTKETKK